MSDEEETDDKIEEETEEETEETKPSSRKWLWIVLGLAVVGIGAYLLLHHPAAAPPSNINNLPSMVGGC